MVPGPALGINKTLFVLKLYIASKIHNIWNIVYNAKSEQNIIAVIIVEIHSQGQIWTVDTPVTDILSVLVLLVNFYKRHFHWSHANTPLYEHMKYESKLWYGWTN